MKSIRSQFQRWLAPVVFSIAVAVTPLHAADTMVQPTQPVATRNLNYVKDGKPNFIALLAPPPLPGSAEQSADMDEVRAVYHAATSNDIAVAYSFKKFDIFTFTPAIGGFFQPGKFPKTEAFFKRVQSDAEAVTDNAKDYYKRPRPFVTDPSLANGKLEKSFSYPSGHSTESMVLALVLADLFPAHRDAIIAEARSIGWHRVMIARHYPTDIVAGRVLAQAIVRQMKKNDAFQKDFAGAKAEIAAVQTAANN
ncbi:MAG TPA: phosphatase PAP2 family protein [Candidatus Aquilonibacter sp.]|nr:phosphatase PAP2 family protein [Candidatus Aquilonibacter sp.]